MNIKEVKQLIDYVNKSDLTEVKWQLDNETITIKKQKEIVMGAGAPMQQMAQAPMPTALPSMGGGTSVGALEEPADNFKTVTSPMVGTYYSSPSPDSDDFVKEGDMISNGQTLCIVEAMKLMNEIESDISGKIIEICVEDGSPVEFGTILFKVQ